MLHKLLKCFLIATGVASLTGCGTYFNQPIDIQQARLGEDTEFSKVLRDFPPPAEPVVVGVYKFRDQTGQYKPTEAGSTFSTAITQGATTILVKALEDSKWFVPIERENLSNLLNERNIIRSTRKEYQKNNNQNQPQLPPLLYAGIILEGGVVSYDTNVITGGLGARYFGIGGSTQYRQDRITVYLRAVSTSNGKILKTVYVSKTILSQALDANFFRYVKFRRLLEAETGYTKNEPTQLAVSEAIEKAVEALIIEGIEDNLWKVNDTPENKQSLIDAYKAEKAEAQQTHLYDRLLKERRGSSSLSVLGGTALISGDFNEALPSYYAGLSGRLFLNSYLSANLSLHKFELKNENAFVEGMNAADLNAELTLLPYDKITPFFQGGIGSVNSDDFKKSYFKFQYGGGLEYLLNDQLGISLHASHHLVLSDELDNLEQGKRDDQYFQFAFGINWYFKNPFKMDKKEREEKRKQKEEVKQLKKRNQDFLKEGQN